MFVLTAITSPTLGVFFGGWIIDRLGGYKGKKQRSKSLSICCIFGACACSVAFPCTFFGHWFYLTIFFLWALLFFGAATLPACTGNFFFTCK